MAEERIRPCRGDEVQRGAVPVSPPVTRPGEFGAVPVSPPVTPAAPPATPAPAAPAPPTKE